MGEVELRRRGFTLIELLVVIALIVLLAALLFPMLSRAKEQGKITSCSKNLQQIYSALAMYCDQWNGFLPDAMPINLSKTGEPLEFEYPGQEPNAAQKQQVHFLLREYIAAKTKSYDAGGVFRCPTDNITPPLERYANRFDKSSKLYEACVFAKYGSSYQWRMGKESPVYLGNTSPDGHKGTDLLGGRPIGSFAQPSKIGAARDAQPWHMYSNTHSRKDWRDPNAGGNVLYLDGHVKFNLGGEFLAGIF